MVLNSILCVYEGIVGFGGGVRESSCVYVDVLVEVFVVVCGGYCYFLLFFWWFVVGNYCGFVLLLCRVGWVDLLFIVWCKVLLWVIWEFIFILYGWLVVEVWCFCGIILVLRIRRIKLSFVDCGDCMWSCVWNVFEECVWYFVWLFIGIGWVVVYVFLLCSYGLFFGWCVEVFMVSYVFVLFYIVG